MININNYIIEKLKIGKDTKDELKDDEALRLTIYLDKANQVTADRIIVKEALEKKVRYSPYDSSNVFSLPCQVTPLHYYENYRDVASTAIDVILPIDAALNFIDCIISTIKLTNKINEYSLKGFPFDKWVYTTITQNHLDKMIITGATLEKLKRWEKEWSE